MMREFARAPSRITPKPLVHELDWRDLRGRQFHSERDAFIRSKPKPSAAAIHTKSRALARKLGLRYEPMGWAEDVSFATPALLEIPRDWPMSEKIKMLARDEKARKAGEPVPWRQVDLQTGEESIVHRPLPVRRAAKGKTGAPGRPRRVSDAEWLKHVADHPLDRPLSPARRAEILSHILRRSISRTTVMRLLEES